MYRPWTHLSVYAIGVACGYFCRNKSEKGSSAAGPYGSGVTNCVGWASSLGVMCALVFMWQDWIWGDLPEPVISGLYDGFHRIVWALAHFWIVYMLTHKDNQNSFVASVVGNKVFVAFGRLTLCVLVLHPIIQLFFLATQQQALFSSMLLIAYVFFGNIAMIYLLSFLVSLFVELPICSLFCLRESTAIKVEDQLNYNKNRPFTISNGNHGELEMKSGKGRDRV
jgi:hypothetical protein